MTPRAHAIRLLDRPIITPDLHPSIGVNIQGPSLIRVPDWIENPHGTYYLYFADHKGSYIRLAYADGLTGPWRVHPPGSLHLAESGFPTAAPVPSAVELAAFEARYRASGTAISHDVLSEITTPHIASPDVHVDAARRRIDTWDVSMKAPPCSLMSCASKNPRRPHASSSASISARRLQDTTPSGEPA